MSYVPPHKRRSSRNNSIAKNNRVGGIQKSLRNREETEANDGDRANEIFFCKYFTFIRCINLAKRPKQWDRFISHARGIGPRFVSKVVRFDAVDGQEAVRQARGALAETEKGTEKPPLYPGGRIGSDVAWKWDTTQNALWDRHVTPGVVREMTPGEIGCALSHVSLWKELARAEHLETYLQAETEREETQHQSEPTMLILEDDVAFLNERRRPQKGPPRAGKKSADRFLQAFRITHTILPPDWDVLYLGFSDRGERKDIVTGRASGHREEEDDLEVQIFQPTYGFHTHAYAIRRSAANKLLQNLPVVGPVDVWLADNDWFGLNVYCAMVANEGWKNTGAPLVCQDISIATTSSVGHSGR